MRKIFKNTQWLYFTTGAGLGYLVVHPLIMLAADMMQARVSFGSYWTEGYHSAILQKAFRFEMLPWGVGFGLLCAMLGWLLAKFNRLAIRRHKLQGVMELAGATCHELNQPMQVVLGYLELLRLEMQAEDPLREELQKIITQIDKMDRILKKVRAITRYEPMEYNEGITIIDIDKASQKLNPDDTI